MSTASTSTEVPIGLNMFVPTRMLGGVAKHDACLVEMDGKSRLGLHLPPYDCPEDSSIIEKRASMNKTHQAVFWSELYPIIPPGIRLSAIPPSIWETESINDMRKGWIDCMWQTGYESCQTGGDHYWSMMDASSQDIFGTEPMKRVVALYRELNDFDLIMHYVFTVSLQFYLICNNSFLQIRTDAAFADYNERLPPYIFMMFRGTDWAWDSTQLSTNQEMTIREDWNQLAIDQSFPIFLHVALCYFVGVGNLRGDSEEKMSRINNFCSQKLCKNFIQSITCMRFREIVPENLCEVVPNCRQTLIKFFAHPKACRMPALNTKETPAHVVERIPQFFCHLFFDPNQLIIPCTNIYPATQKGSRHLLWRMLLFYPLATFRQTIEVAGRKLWSDNTTTTDPDTMSDDSDSEPIVSTTGVFPKDTLQKWTSYEGIIPLNKVRARYAMYFKNNQAYLFVSNLLLPCERAAGILPHNDTDIREMTPQTWKWCCNRIDPKTISLPSDLNQVSPPLSDRERFVIQTQNPLYNKGITSCSYWLFYWSLVRIFQSEEKACSILNAMNISLQSIQQHYQQYIDLVIDNTIEPTDLVTKWKHEQWDRCSFVVPDQPMTSEHLFIWSLLFPVSVITFDGKPWIQNWVHANPTPKLKNTLSNVLRLLTHPQLDQEMKRLEQSGMRLPEDTQQQLVEIIKIALQQSQINTH